MQSSKLRLSLVLMSTFGLILACADDASTAGGESSGLDDTSDGTAGQDGMDGMDSMEGMEGTADGDGNDEIGDGDGDSGDGDSGDGDSGDGDGDSGDGDSGDGDGDGDPLMPKLCDGKVYACGDTLDNDMDGSMDLDDPECTTPCDDDEGTFKTNLPGQNVDCKSDCYFDANSGSGDDSCEWDLKCDPKSPGAQIGCEYDPNFAMCELQTPDTCLDFCGPLVPNGCDCFGCCEIEGQYVYLGGAECSLETLDQCESCTFTADCINPCEPDTCELCFPGDPQQLPPECEEPNCPDGVTPCLAESDCGAEQFCQTGCCVEILPD